MYHENVNENSIMENGIMINVGASVKPKETPWVQEGFYLESC